MFEKYCITVRMRNVILILSSAIILALTSVGLILPASWIGKPFPGFLVRGKNCVAGLYNPNWAGIKRGIRDQDIIVEVNGKPVSEAKDLRRLILASKPGEPITYKIERGILNISKHEITVPVSIFTAKDYLYCATASILGLFWALIAAMVFYLKPNDPLCRVMFAAFNFAAIMSVTFLEQFTTNYTVTVGWIVFSGLVPSLLILAMYFPYPYAKRDRFIAPILKGYVVLLSVFVGIYYFSNAQNFIRLDWFVRYLAISSQVILVGLVTHSFLTSKDLLIRKKFKVIIYAGIVYFPAWVIIALASWRFDIPYNFIYLLPIGFLLPASIGYSAAVNNVFDADTVIQRSLSYMLVSGVIVALFFGITALFGLVLAEVTSQYSQVAVVASTLLVVALFKPLRDRVDGILDRRFYREKYEYRKTIQAASEQLVTIIDLKELQRKLLEIVMDAMKIERGVIFIKESEADVYAMGASRGYDNVEPNEPLNSQNAIVRVLERDGKAVQKNDVESSERLREHREELLASMHKLDIVLVIPIRYEKKLLGVLGLSAKKSGAWYSTEDIDLLQTLMNQAAISVINAQKVEASKVARFLSPSVAKAMVRGFDELTAIKRKRLTIFFSDIRGFTGLSDEMEPEETIELLNHYLREMTEIIFEHGGTLDKFMGDGIMVFFNDPIEQDNHPTKAVLMAIQMQQRMSRLQEKWFDAGKKPLSIGIGINTGYVTVGGIGSEHRMDYTCIGNQVNLASRLQSLAASGEIIISHATYGEVKDFVDVKDRGEVEVKGIQRPVKIYEVLGSKS